MVDDLDLFGPISRPYEADAPLRIYTDAVLALSVVSQSLKAVSRRNLQVIKNCRPVQLRKLSKGGTFDVYPTLDALTLKEGLGVLALEASDRHRSIVMRGVNSVKRHRGRQQASNGLGEWLARFCLNRWLSARVST